MSGSGLYFTSSERGQLDCLATARKSSIQVDRNGKTRVSMSEKYES